MLTFYDWKVRRSGAGLRILGTSVDHTGTIRERDKISNIGQVTIFEGKLAASDRDTHEIVAWLSTYHKPRH